MLQFSLILIFLLLRDEKKEYKDGGELALKWGNGKAAKFSIRKYKVHSWILKDSDDMDIDELREALRLERALKKHLAKTSKEKYFAIFNCKIDLCLLRSF